VAYDRQSQRTGLTLGNGTSAKYGYNLRGDLLCLDWNFAGAAPANCNSGALSNGLGANNPVAGVAASAATAGHEVKFNTCTASRIDGGC